MPLLSIKIRWQENKPFTLNPVKLSEGICSNLGSFPIVMAVQFLVFDALTKTNSSKNILENATAASLSGIAAAPIACIADSIITQKTMNPRSELRIVNDLIKAGGYKNLFSGFVATAIRECKVAPFLFVVPEIINEWLKPHIQDNDYRKHASDISSGLLGGFFSQPADVVKTKQQQSIKPLKFIDAAKSVYTEHQLPGFFRGMTPRATSIGVSVWAVSFAAEKLKSDIPSI